MQIQVPTDPISPKILNELTARVGKMLATAKVPPTELNLARGKELLVRNFEARFGRSDLTIWRLTQLDVPQLLQVSTWNKPKVRPTLMQPVLSAQLGR